MTCGFGTKSIPKDYTFENILRANLSSDKFDRVIYYDSCILAKSSKMFGKIIISDECLYSYIENIKKFSIFSEFRDFHGLELLNDIPHFILGPMRDDCIHLRLSFYTRTLNIGSKTFKEKSQHLCCKKSTETTNSESEEPILPNESDYNSTLIPTKESINEYNKTSNSSFIQPATGTGLVESADIYILNKFSPFLSLLKKAYINYQIRETYSPDSNASLVSSSLSPTLLGQLFDKLNLDIVSNIKSIDINRTYLCELIHSGNQNFQIKILFWSKSNLFDMLVEQFTERLGILFSLDNSDLQTTLRFKNMVKINLEYLNLILKVLNVFLCETDHFYSKWAQLRKHSANISLSLVHNIIRLISYFNIHDRLDLPELEPTEEDKEIDFAKYDLTINSIQCFYYLICSSQVPFTDDDHDVDPFTIRTISALIETLVSYDNNDALFNSFINQVLRMIFIWLFPEIYKFKDQSKLNAEQMVVLFQWLSSLRTIINCIPKLMEILRKEMKDEFHYFIYHEIQITDNYPLSKATNKLLKSFQKNMTNHNDVFID